MGRLEQPVGAAPAGGGVTMIEEALTVIENYLKLVRDYLPESIAIDVIEELRAYIIDAAEEEGGGSLTVESAKRTVARFGAPSEVAEEYKESMMLDEEEEDAEVSVSSSPPITTPKSAIHEKSIRTADISPDRVSSNIEAMFHFILVAGILICLTAYPAWITALIIAPIQLALITGFAIWIAFRNAILGIKPTKRSYDDWPFLQRLVSYPDKFLPLQSKVGLMFELALMLCTVAATVVSPPMLVIVPAFLFRILILTRRLSDNDPISYARADFAVEFISVLSINLGFFLSFTSSFYWYNPLFPIVAILAGFFDVFMVIRLTALVPDLWIQSEDLSSKSHSITTIEIADKGGRPTSHEGVFAKTAILSLFWTVVIPLFIFPFTSSASFIGYYMIFVIFFQIPGLMGLQLGNIARIKRKGTILWDESNSSWSLLRRFLTLPKGTYLEQSTTILRADLLFTFILAVASLSVMLTYNIPLDLQLSLLLFATFMGIRVILLDDRWRNPVERSFDRAEFFVNIAILIIGTFILSMFFRPDDMWSRFWARYELQNYFYAIWSFLSLYLLFSTVARGQTLWKDRVPEEPRSERTKISDEVPYDRPRIRKLVTEQYGNALSEVAGWSAVLGIVMGIVILMGLDDLSVFILFTYGSGIGILIGITLFAGLVLTTLYFVWRRNGVAKEMNPRVIGKRRRIEATIDLLVTGYAFWFVLSNQMTFLNLARGYASHLTSLSEAHTPIGIVISTLFMTLLFLTPLIRVFSDLGGLVGGDNRFSRNTLMTSGAFYVILLGILVGMTPYSGFGTFLQASVYGFTGLILLLAAPIILQTITSKFHMMEIPRELPRSRKEPLIEDLGHGEIDLPIN